MILIFKFIARMLMGKPIFEFLKSDNVNGAVLEATTGIRRIEDSMVGAGYMQEESTELARKQSS